MTPNHFIFIYTTFPNEQIAEKIGQQLLVDKLIAGLNLWPIKSYYHWEGKLKQRTEIAAGMKTLSFLFPKIEKFIQVHHPYQNPCLFSIPAENIALPFLKWCQTTVKN